MTSNPRVEGEYFHHYQQVLYREHLAKQIGTFVSQFEKQVRSYALFNLLFIIIGAFEIVLIISGFSLLVQTSILGFSLGFVFLTFFFYCLLRVYFQTKKPEQYRVLRAKFLEQTKRLLHYEDRNPESHIALAGACCKLADQLSGREYQVWRLPKVFHSFRPMIEKWCCFCFWEDYHLMKELLLTASIDEQIQLVTCEPTNLEFHAALANAYVLLSALYVDPRKLEGPEDERWLPQARTEEGFRAKFRQAAERAIEEFKIMNDYAPNDSWVHAQLAYSYHDLQMPDEEIKEYEILLSLHPSDKEILFKLGRLYFEQGHNAKGLRIYEALKHMHYKKAEQLLAYYGAYTCS